MDSILALSKDNFGVADNKTKGEKMAKVSSISSAPRKKLDDISNLQQQARSNQDAKTQQSISLSTEEYIGKLQKDYIVLMKVLSDKNKIIEWSGIELQNLRINLQKVQQQNLQLAQANSQMLAELNSGKDRLKALQHELGCKNGLLKARELQLEKKAKTKALQISETEVGKIKCDEAVESIEADKGSDKPCNTNRRRHSKTKTLDPSTVRLVQSKEKVNNKRLSVKRQSARFNPQEPEPTQTLSEEDDSKEKDDKKRLCVRRQSARVKCQEPGPTEDLFEIEAKVKDDNKRLCERRQSARFRSQEPEATEDFFEIDDAKFLVSPFCDQMVDKGSPTSSGSSVQKDHEEGKSASGNEAQEIRRTSVGRPLRQAAGRVQSYKEIPLNVKMRRRAE